MNRGMIVGDEAGPARERMLRFADEKLVTGTRYPLRQWVA
jgi:hypothetical protein